MTDYLLDTHYHFDFIENEDARNEFLNSIHQLGWGIVAQTVLPSKYNMLYHSEIRPSKISLGFHPWYIQSNDQADKELAIFRDLISTTHYIGEIGMDFSNNGLKYAERALQEKVFEQVLQIVCEEAVKSEQAYILSVHAVHCIDEILETFEELHIEKHNVIPIIHRFNGTSDELTRLIRGGGYLSVHPEMLAKKKGRAYVQQIPKDRILLETDLPQTDNTIESCIQEFNQTMLTVLEAVSNLRDEEMTSIIQSTQVETYG
ncbi:TatD family hydrolase [Aerococcaceae bacterium DSM 111020]|nr:TatD family hydrolase [Aerococcaceae bacterium DSM 111020]